MQQRNQSCEAIHAGASQAGIPRAHAALPSTALNCPPRGPHHVLARRRGPRRPHQMTKHLGRGGGRARSTRSTRSTLGGAHTAQTRRCAVTHEWHGSGARGTAECEALHPAVWPAGWRERRCKAPRRCLFLRLRRAKPPAAAAHWSAAGPTSPARRAEASRLRGSPRKPRQAEGRDMRGSHCLGLCIKITCYAMLLHVMLLHHM
jgi:hypothetical protein